MYSHRDVVIRITWCVCWRYSCSKIWSCSYGCAVHYPVRRRLSCCEESCRWQWWKHTRHHRPSRHGQIGSSPSLHYRSGPPPPRSGSFRKQGSHRLTRFPPPPPRHCYLVWVIWRWVCIFISTYSDWFVRYLFGPCAQLFFLFASHLFQVYVLPRQPPHWGFECPGSRGPKCPSKPTRRHN